MRRNGTLPKVRPRGTPCIRSGGELGENRVKTRGRLRKNWGEIVVELGKIRGNYRENWVKFGGKEVMDGRWRKYLGILGSNAQDFLWVSMVLKGV